MNWIDLTIIIVLLLAAYRGWLRGFAVGILGLVSTIVDIFLALWLYKPIASWIEHLFSLPSTTTPLIVFLALILLFEVMAGVGIMLVDQYIVKFLYKSRFIKYTDKTLGILPAVAIAGTLIILVLFLPVTLPISASLKQDVEDSYWGQNIQTQAYGYLPQIESLAHGLPTESLLYLIPKSPSSEENVTLTIPHGIALRIDDESEARMLVLVNQERTSRGLKPLILDKTIVPVARKHSSDMFLRSYFSHTNPEGESPFDRMKDGGIQYRTAGENLAYAPSVAIAHEGLMNSPGHKANILNPDFGRVGIGIIDGGIYGKMFTQNFAD